ncbi:MAG: 16S rRNA (cytosine(967)-C(5))-methyltransferase RsmB [Gammaproteobacteria bacterium]|nr:16S rRNA (cytosine(967)-C(5))-methyltransferase RsmB [Gammaproteobacteria bacterium]
MTSNDRAIALQHLVRCIETQQPLQAVESPLTKALCFGVTRYYPRLECIASHLVTKHPKDLTVWICILMGLYQIDTMDMPDYAAVQETVALLQTAKKVWAKGFVNAILRRYCRERAAIEIMFKDDPVFTYAHPAWLIEKIQQDWPEDWRSMLQANQAHPPFSLRINTQQTNRDAYQARLITAAIPHQPLAHTEAGVILEQACNVQDIPGFMTGDVSIQDGAAQLAGPLLDLSPGMRVLDACCAPGGKISQILDLVPQLASCVGIDIDAKRIQRVRDNCERLQIHPDLQTADAGQPETWWDGVPFDRILLDAPCSATGIIRRHPDIKLLRHLEDIHTVTAIQTHLLKVLWPLVAPGGILLYATCSIMPEENEKQIATFLENHPDATLNADPQSWGRVTGHGWQILPGEDQMDGFFYAKIEKTVAP